MDEATTVSRYQPINPAAGFPSAAVVLNRFMAEQAARNITEVFQIVAKGTATALDVTTVADGTNTYSGGQTTTITHGLGFTPLAIAFVEVSPSQYALMPYTETVSAGGGGILSSFYRLTTSSTSVEIFHYVVSYSPSLGAGTYSGANIRYYLLQEPST